jgi:hypothetical protein
MLRYLGLNGKYSEEIKKIVEKTDCAYTLKPGRITIVGLQDIDFDKIKFVTIIADNTQTIMKSGKV